MKEFLKRVSRVSRATVAGITVLVGLVAMALMHPGHIEAGPIPFPPLTNNVLTVLSTNGTSYTWTSTNFALCGGNQGLAIFTDVSTVGLTNSLTNSVSAVLSVSKDNVTFYTPTILTNNCSLTNATANAYHNYQFYPATLFNDAAWGQFSVTVITTGTNNANIAITTAQFP